MSPFNQIGVICISIFAVLILGALTIGRKSQNLMPDPNDPMADRPPGLDPNFWEEKWNEQDQEQRPLFQSMRANSNV